MGKLVGLAVLMLLVLMLFVMVLVVVVDKNGMGLGIGAPIDVGFDGTIWEVVNGGGSRNDCGMEMVLFGWIWVA